MKVDVATYRNQLASVRSCINSVKGAAGDKEFRNELDIACRAVDEMNAMECRTAKPADRIRAAELVTEVTNLVR